MPEIGINSSLYKSRSKKSLKYKTPKSRSKKKVSNESVDLSEEDLDDAYQNNIVNLKLNNNIGK